ncbi:MAG TPA: hypothetical protein DDZ36_10675 [Deltaproteobacteria bacterium]|nr:hypothetical protein [Deltaproteobacteria bacterium]
MCLKSNQFIFRLSVLLLIAVSGCSNFPEKTYVQSPKSFRKQVNLVCLQTDASHFTVRNLRVRFKLLNGEELELKHYNSLLPDGYYFCTQQQRKSTILE